MSMRGSHRVGDEGSATLEVAVLAPALLMLVGLVVVTGRLGAATGVVEQAAASGAREASLSRSAAAAHAAAEASVRRSLLEQDVRCAPMTVSVSTSGFSVAVGNPGEVRVSVSCTVQLSDQGVPGLMGSRVLRADVVSPIDSYRGR
jgi:Flp pilus assembly protein TadG